VGNVSTFRSMSIFINQRSPWSINTGKYNTIDIQHTFCFACICIYISASTSIHYDPEVFLALNTASSFSTTKCSPLHSAVPQGTFNTRPIFTNHHIVKCNLVLSRSILLRQPAPPLAGLAPAARGKSRTCPPPSELRLILTAGAGAGALLTWA
jgi:hypothetical protein